MEVKKAELVKRVEGEGRKVVNVTVEREGKEYHIDIRSRDVMDEQRFRRILESFDREIAEQADMNKISDAKLKRKLNELEGMEVDGHMYNQRMTIPFVTKEQEEEARKHHIKAGGEK